MVAQRREIEVVLRDNGSHAGAPIVSLDRNTIDVRFQNAVEPTERELHLGSGDVLAFPAERVADTVDEIEIAAPVLAHEVAGTKPGVALLEHIAHTFLCGFRRAGIALETSARPRG